MQLTWSASILNNEKHLPWITVCSNLQYYDQPYYLEKHMDLVNDIFTFVFIVELFIKLLALRGVSFQVSRLFSIEIVPDTLLEEFCICNNDFFHVKSSYFAGTSN